MRTLFCLVLVTLFIAEAAPQRSRHHGHAARTVHSSLSPAEVNNPQWSPVPSAATILRAQILLARAHFSPGEMDGRAGDNFERALSGFRRSRSLSQTAPETAPETGILDEATWNALNAQATPVLTTYTITPQDAAGPFVQIPESMQDKAKLPALGYQSLEEALAERFHVSPDVLRRLNPGSQLAPGETITIPDTGPPLSNVKAARIVVTKSGTLTAFDQEGRFLAQYPCSSGSEHDPLPIGQWKINGVARNPKFHYNPDLFWDARKDDPKATIAPGPNNPVGVVWIDLSKEHYGIHGSPDPGKVGHTQSHGCIRLTNWDALELAGMVSPGVAVECVA